MEFINSLLPKMTSFIGSLNLGQNHIRAAAIAVLVFILILALAKFRHHTIDWSLKGGIVGLFFGFLLTLILEGFLLVNGHTALTNILGWQNPPKPISTALDIGKEKLTSVLGVATDNPSTKDAINVLQSLDPGEISKIKAIICTP